MKLTKERFIANGSIRARAVGGEWVNGSIQMMSQNNKSCQIALDHPLGVGGFGLAFSKGKMSVVMLLSRDDNNKWYDIFTGAEVEMESAI